MTCPCQHSMPVPGAFPKAAGHLSIDRAALRRELGGDAGVRVNPHQAPFDLVAAAR